VEGVKTTATQAFQLWLRPNLSALGFTPDGWGLPSENSAANSLVYANSFNSWIDYSVVLPAEDWPADYQPGLVAYFTGAMTNLQEPPPHSASNYPAEQLQRVQDGAEQWLMNQMGFFWPAITTLEFPQGLAPALLTVPKDGSAPTSVVMARYFRANVSPSERYTLSVPGSGSYRLSTTASGYDNLFLAGDWIDYGLNVGCIEGAVSSGIQAAQAVQQILDGGLPQSGLRAIRRVL
jgi:uncharacterized protein with NAD-binding domain and iron-sulfur cluster